MKAADDTIVAILTAIRLGAPPRLLCQSFGVPWESFVAQFDQADHWKALEIPLGDLVHWPARHALRQVIYRTHEQYKEEEARCNTV